MKDGFLKNIKITLKFRNLEAQKVFLLTKTHNLNITQYLKHSHFYKMALNSPKTLLITQFQLFCATCS